MPLCVCVGGVIHLKSILEKEDIKMITNKWYSLLQNIQADHPQEE